MDGAAESDRHRPARRCTRLRIPLAALGLGLMFLVSACSGGESVSVNTGTPTTPGTPAAPADGATVAAALSVPPALRSPPFDVARALDVPGGAQVAVVARVPHARFMAVAPNGDLLVSDPGGGTITLLRPAAGGGAATAFTFARGLTNPHDMVFATIGGTAYLYVAESNRIARAPYAPGATSVGSLQTVVGGLPDASSPELGGAYGHQLKNIAIHGDRLYVSIASTCNVCASDAVSDPVRSAIYQYDLDGGNRRLFARGLRNAEGLAFRPGTDELWVTVNNRDNVPFPFHADWDGDGADDYGRVMQSYVDSHPPDFFTRVRDGGNYGWPFCNADPDNGLDNMPYDRDVQTNPSGSRLDCGAIDRATKGLPPHSAPLGMSFLDDASLPAALRNAAAVALHGCWNCSRPNGRKVVLLPLYADGTVGAPADLAAGWLDDASGQAWGRPVDVVPDGRGGLYVSDDFSGTVYRLTFGG
ncbi:MAG: PQQ-dependent sugar dehydrogenase [Burkholderiaceae bacterium]